jgi:hypothetical protein
VPIDQRSSFFRTNTSTTIDLLRAFELRGTLSRILGVAGWSIGKSGRGPTNDISPVKIFQSRGVSSSRVRHGNASDREARRLSSTKYVARARSAPKSHAPDRLSALV